MLSFQCIFAIACGNAIAMANDNPNYYPLDGLTLEMKIVGDINDDFYEPWARYNGRWVSYHDWKNPRLSAKSTKRGDAMPLKFTKCCGIPNTYTVQNGWPNKQFSIDSQYVSFKNGKDGWLDAHNTHGSSTGITFYHTGSHDWDDWSKSPPMHAWAYTMKTVYKHHNNWITLGCYDEDGCDWLKSDPQSGVMDAMAVQLFHLDGTRVFHDYETSQSTSSSTSQSTYDIATFAAAAACSSLVAGFAIVGARYRGRLASQQTLLG